MTFEPATVDEIQEAVRTHQSVIVRGGGTKSPAAGGVRADAVIELRRLAGMTYYSPSECVFTAFAGTPLADITATLAMSGQYLPFDPPLAAAGATIGGTVATGLSGSGRQRYGGVRDFIIGARVVDGEGRLIASGGKVVKNAAGFLLHHGLVGSMGRFGVLTEVSMKVFPAPEARTTLRLVCGDVGKALDALSRILALRIDVDALDFDASGTMWIRVAGRAETVPARVANLRRLLVHDADTIEGDGDRVLWSEVNEFAWLPQNASLLKIPLTAARIAALLECCAGLVRDPGTVRFTSAGSAAWIAFSSNLDEFSRRLAHRGFQGLVIRGHDAGERVGVTVANAFEERVRRALDPVGRFSAAQYSRS